MTSFVAEAIAPVLNKVGAFTANPIIRNIIGQPKSTFNIRQIMDEGKILIVNLSKGLIGEDNAAILGSFLVTKIQLAAMSRSDILTSAIAAHSIFTSTSSRTSPPIRLRPFCPRLENMALI